MTWGLEIDSDMLRVCRAELRRGALRLHRQAEVAVPPGLIRPSLKDPNLTEGAALSGILRDLCRNVGCRGWVRVALPDPIYSLRTLTTDEVPAKREEARRFLRWQARDLLPFPAEEARLDFLPPTAGSDGRQRVVCLMARDRTLTEYERVLKEAGLRASVLDARSVSLAQAASAWLGSGTAGLLAVSRLWSTLLAVQSGQPRFWRTIPEGTEAWAGPDRARLFREIADSISFWRESEGMEPLERLTLTGLGSMRIEVVSALTEWLEVPVTSLEPATALQPEGLNGGWPDILDDWGPAIGVAIRSC